MAAKGEESSRMLLNLREYHRPASDGRAGGLDRALALLARPGIRTALLAGGSALLASADQGVEAVVDLQGLGLDRISPEPVADGLSIGAMVTRAALGASAGVQAACNGIVVQAAMYGGGSVQRNRATVGGALAKAAWDDSLVVALLASDATVILYSVTGWQELALHEFLPQRAACLALPALITEIRLPHARDQWAAALANVARTPSDAPIVCAAVALGVQEGRCTMARIALSGVSAQPERRTAAEGLLVGCALDDTILAAAAEQAAAGLLPPDDPRGSAAYRSAMASTVSYRALSQAAGRLR